jgi:hypothetical protein
MKLVNDHLGLIRDGVFPKTHCGMEKELGAQLIQIGF